MLEVLYHYAKFGGTQISPATGQPKTLSYFVCLSVRHASECQSLWADFAMKELE